MNPTTSLRSLATIAAGVQSEKSSSSRGSHWTQRVESTHQKNLTERIEKLSKKYLDAFCKHIDKMDAYTSLVIGLEPLAGSELFKFYELPLRNLLNKCSTILDEHLVTQNSPVPQNLAGAYFQYKTKLLSLTDLLVSNANCSGTLDIEKLTKAISIFEKMIPFLEEGREKFVTHRGALGNYILTLAQPAASASQSSASPSSFFKTSIPQQNLLKPQTSQRRPTAYHSAQSVAQVASQIIRQSSSSSSSTQSYKPPRLESPVRTRGRKRPRDETSSLSSTTLKPPFNGPVITDENNPLIHLTRKPFNGFQFGFRKRRKITSENHPAPNDLTNPSPLMPKRKPFRGHRIGSSSETPQQPTSSSLDFSETLPTEMLLSLTDGHLKKLSLEQLKSLLFKIQALSVSIDKAFATYRSDHDKTDLKNIHKAEKAFVKSLVQTGKKDSLIKRISCLKKRIRKYQKSKAITPKAYLARFTFLYNFIARA